MGYGGQEAAVVQLEENGVARLVYSAMTRFLICLEPCEHTGRVYSGNQYSRQKALLLERCSSIFIRKKRYRSSVGNSEHLSYSLSFFDH